MSKRSILFLGFGLSILVWLLNYTAMVFYLYWTVWWYDIVMHFLGGVTVGVLVMWLLAPARPFLRAFFAVLAIIIGWEVFEYVNGEELLHPENYAIDVLIDMVMGALGMVASYFITSRSQESF